MDNTEKELTLDYLKDLLEIKHTDLGKLIGNLNDIYSGQSGASLSGCVNSINIKIKEMENVSKMISNFDEELNPDPIPGP